MTLFADSPLRRLAQQPHRPAPGGWEESRPPAPPERCELCSEPLPETHRHLLDLATGAPACACRACTILFDQQAAGGKRYRLLRERRTRLGGCTIDESLWAGLGVPVDLAFFVREEASGEVTAGYPSPLGTTRSTVNPKTWNDVTQLHPALSDLADDVEALLVHRKGGTDRHWIVPVDDCYRLVAVVRSYWQGFTGGPEVWEQVEQFFTELTPHH